MSQDQEQIDPLTNLEKREIILRLQEVQLLRDRVRLQQEYIERDEEQDKRELELNQQALANVRAELALAKKERDLALEKAKHFQDAFEAVKKIKKPRGFWCKLKKALTLGIARCG